MIRFAVLEDSGPAQALPLEHACLVGKEDLTIPGTLSFEGGVLTCKRHSTDAAGVSLMVDVGPAGRLALQTCLLPDRAEPYLLALELARHRIMMVLNKLESWGLADLSSDHPIMAGLDRARELFTRALIAPRDPSVGWTVEHARLARQALIVGIDVSERLAILAAERELQARWSAATDAPGPAGAAPAESQSPDDTAAGISVLGKVQLGCSVHAGQFAEPLQKIIARDFDFVSCPIRWSEIEKDEGRRSFVATDRWIEWAVRTGKLPVAGGPIIDFSPRGLPRWMSIWENDYKTIRDLAYEHVKAVVTRYRRGVSRWTVCSGININSEFNLRLEEMIDLTRLAVLSVRKLQPNATILVEIDQPFGEHASHIDRSIAPFLYASLVKESGMGIDGFALRLQVGDGDPGRASRDLMSLSAIIDTFAELDRPIHITAIGAPSASARRAPEPAPTAVAGATKKPDLSGPPGHWRAPWSPAQQVEWMTRALTIATSKPSVFSVCWQALFDVDTTPDMRHGGLITSDGHAKPALKRMEQVAAAVRARVVPTRHPAIVPAPSDEGRPAAAGVGP